MGNRRKRCPIKPFLPGPRQGEWEKLLVERPGDCLGFSLRWEGEPAPQSSSLPPMLVDENESTEPSSNVSGPVALLQPD